MPWNFVIARRPFQYIFFAFLCIFFLLSVYTFLPYWISICFSFSFVSLMLFIFLQTTTSLNTTDNSFAVAIVIASLAGPQWLLTEEKIRNPNFNGTINYNNAIDDGMYILKTTKSSLWILCFAQGNFPGFLVYFGCQYAISFLDVNMLSLYRTIHWN